MDKIPNEWLSEVFMCQLVGLGNVLKDHLSAKKFVFKLIHYGKLGQWGGAKVYHQRSLASVNVRVSCSGEVSQRQAGSRLSG